MPQKMFVRASSEISLRWVFFKLQMLQFLSVLPLI